MKGDIIFALLRALGDLALDSVDLFAVFLQAGYGASYKKVDAMFEQRQQARATDHFRREQATSQKQRYYNFVYYLVQQDLITATPERGSTKKFAITRKGKNILRAFQKKQSTRLPPANYPASQTKQWILVVFDIPESQRKKRDWLRAVLRNLGFQCIQKSVWIGHVKIPKLLVDDLDMLHLLPHVEILEVTKTGSLQEIITASHS